jgi:hypothetical protein
MHPTDMSKPARQLRFNTIDDVHREVQSLLDADRAGGLSTTGQWSLGTSLGHLATWIEYSYRPEGAPVSPPWILRFFAKLMKSRFLNKPMPAGMRMGKLPAGTLGVDEMSTAEGAARFLPLLDRLSREAPTAKNPLFGFMTHEEWKKLHLRHAELHLGFFNPSGRDT